MASIEVLPKSFGRIVSIDIRTNRLAFVYVKNGELCVWGTKTFRQGSPTERLRRFAIPEAIALLDDFAPHAILVPHVSGTGAPPRSAGVVKATAAVVRTALARKIGVHVLSKKTVKTFVRPLEQGPAKNIQDINEAVAIRFSELPLDVKRRGTCDQEQYSAALLNAAAMYVAFERYPSLNGERDVAKC